MRKSALVAAALIAGCGGSPTLRGQDVTCSQAANDTHAREVLMRAWVADSGETFHSGDEGVVYPFIEAACSGRAGDYRPLS